VVPRVQGQAPVRIHLPPEVAPMTQKLVVSLFALAAGTLAWSQSPARQLARLLEEKGVISPSDLSRVEQLDAESRLEGAT
jgi:hypothetical protein